MGLSAAKPGHGKVGGQMTISADVRYLVVVRRFVQEAVLGLGADQRTAEDLIHAADELSANIILHGYGSGPGDIEVIVRPEGDGVAVVLRDQAPPFDPAVVSEPNLNVPLEQRPVGGLGIFLSRKLTDELRYRALPEGGNELTLVKHRLNGGAPTSE